MDPIPPQETSANDGMFEAPDSSELNHCLDANLSRHLVSLEPDKILKDLFLLRPGRPFEWLPTGDNDSFEPPNPSISDHAVEQYNRCLHKNLQRRLPFRGGITSDTREAFGLYFPGPVRGLASLLPETRDASRLKDNPALLDNAPHRQFPCVFGFAGCDIKFAYKSDWKQHVYKQHLCLKPWVCSLCVCNRNSTESSSASEKGARGAYKPFSIFHREDRYLDHLRHAHPELRQNLAPEDYQILMKSFGRGSLRQSPKSLRCPVPECGVYLNGLTSWCPYMEHVGDHLDDFFGLESYMSIRYEDDKMLIQWALDNGIIEFVYGKYRILTHEVLEEVRHVAEGKDELGKYHRGLSFQQHFQPGSKKGCFEECVKNEIEYTDSGYASALNPDYLSNVSTAAHKAKVSAPGDQADKIGDDTRTTYFGATTVMPEVYRQWISDVCKDVYSKLELHLDDKTFESISATLPGMIKTLALKLGSDASDEFNQRIMHFVHKHHQEIATQLCLLFQQPKSLTDDQESMSLLDKMSMWNQNFDSEQRLDNCDLFEGIDDIEEDEVDQEAANVDKSELSLYSNAIMNSKAYDWFVTQVLRNSSLHYSETQISSSIQQIRQKILKSLPAGSISKSRVPNTYTVGFHLPWRSSNLNSGIEYDPFLVQPKQPLSECIVLSCSSDDQLQAATVRQYLDQTWSSGGKELLYVLQQALDASHAVATLPDKTALQGFHDDTGICISVTGPPYSISECGEQLAWLVAALHPSDPDSVVHSTPVITINDSTKVEHANLLCQHHWKLRCDQTSSNATASLNLLRIKKSVFSPSIVRGFPTMRRPNDFSGIEVTPGFLFDCIKSSNLDLTSENVVLKGHDIILELVKETAGVLFWRISGLNSPCPHRILLEHNNKPLNLTNILDLHNYRHILGDCDSGNKASRNDESLAVTNTDGKPLEPVGSAAISSAGYDSPADTHCSISNPTVTIVASTISFDSDLLSMSETSEERNFQPLCREDPISSSILNTVVYHLLGEYQNIGITKAWKNSNPVAENRFLDEDTSLDGSNRSSHTSSGSVSASIAPSQGSKRLCQIAPHPRGDDGDDETPDDGSSKRPFKRPRLDDTRPSRKVLACPFWKLDPSTHRCCFRMKLSGISRVKQHLTRNHTPEFYCEFCLLISLDEESHQKHIRSRLCSYKSCEFNGITHGQQRLLSRKSKSKLSESDQWFVIWDIVFPDQPRPASSYVDQDLSEEMSQFREYAQAFGPAVLAEEIRAHLSSANAETGPESLGEGTGLNIESVVSHGMSILFEAWLSRRASSMRSIPSVGSHSSSDRHTESTTRSRRPQGPPSSFADSGVTMRSHVSSDNSRRILYPPTEPYQEEIDDHGFQTQAGLATIENERDFLNIDENPVFTFDEYGLPGLDSYGAHELEIVPPSNNFFKADLANGDPDIP